MNLYKCNPFNNVLFRPITYFKCSLVYNKWSWSGIEVKAGNPASVSFLLLLPSLLMPNTRQRPRQREGSRKKQPFLRLYSHLVSLCMNFPCLGAVTYRICRILLVPSPYMTERNARTKFFNLTRGGASGLKK